MELTVKVTEDFSLDAGTVTEHPEYDDSILILPPEPRMFEQLWERLEDLPEPTIGYNNWALGIGATALCLRWGTYLAVLMDESKPVDRRATNLYCSVISDQEMKRINIEASSNLAFILRLWSENEPMCYDALRRAYEWLPMPQRHVKRDRQALNSIFAAFGTASNLKGEQIIEPCHDAIAHPFRALANTLIVLTYRNGPIEAMHAGRKAAYRLDRRRFTNEQIRDVVRSAAAQMSGVMGVGPLWREGMAHFPSWPQRVAGLPYLFLYPHGWSMTESTSQVRLLKEWTEGEAFF